jgi:hypothetical protein
MPKHARQQIREAVEALMKTPPLPSIGSRVHVGRTRGLEKEHDGTLLIYTTLPENPETSQVLDTGDVPSLERELTLAIAASVDRAYPPDDDLDTIALEVEARVGAKQMLGGLVQEMTLTRTHQDVNADGARQIGRMVMHWRVKYETAEGNPQTAI